MIKHRRVSTTLVINTASAAVTPPAPGQPATAAHRGRAVAAHLTAFPPAN